MTRARLLVCDGRDGYQHAVQTFRPESDDSMAVVTYCGRRGSAEFIWQIQAEEIDCERCRKEIGLSTEED